MVTVEETYLPITLSVPAMTEAKFREFCDQYSDFRLEYMAEGHLIIMPPTDPDTSARNLEIAGQLRDWNRKFGHGRATESSGGYLLPNGARLAPDVSWSSRERRLSNQPPEFVIELVFPEDRINKLHSKMLEWIENGVQLGWLIDPSDRTVVVYRPNQPAEEHTGLSSIEGEGPVVGFHLDLEAVWEV